MYPEIGLAAGACSGNGILMDISDPVNPKRLDYVADKGFAYWHSATFNNDGTKVVFTDEWGGGGRPRCRATDPLTWGADAIYDIVDKKLVHKGYYKMPAPQTDTENCVAHNGSLIPVPGRDIMVQSWYQGGVSVFDFTDSANPVEIAFFDRGPINPKELVTGGYWSSYWYNGHIYGAEISRGIDVFRLLPSEYLTRTRSPPPTLVRFEEFNSQNQPRYVWPAELRRRQGLSRPAGAQQDHRPGARQGAARRPRPAATRALAGARRARHDGLPTLETRRGGTRRRRRRRIQAMAEAIKARTARLR